MIHINNRHRQLQSLEPYLTAQRGNRYFERIYAELRYLCTLSNANQGEYDALIRQVAADLASCLAREEHTTAQHVDRVEQQLQPLETLAKSYEFLCVAHAHIDMVWMWGYQETVGAVLDTMRTMLDFMEEYPDFRFSQSQASVYRIVQQHSPQMLQEIGRCIAQGRWEVTAATWVEADKNMSNGESMARHLLYTKSYFEQTLGIAPNQLKIDFEPDTFGHSANVPELLCGGGVEFYYHCRGQVGDEILYRWQAPSGAEVVLYNEPFWYNSAIDHTIADHATELARITGSNSLLRVYGVGNHGGGPTRKDIEAIGRMNSWPLYPVFRFATMHEYFEKIKHRKSQLPQIVGEINYVCDGCYTTQSRIKAGNRQGQRLLREGEFFSSLATVLCSHPYPSAQLHQSWTDLLFNQFHDIITGSGVADTREYACGKYQDVFAATQSARKLAQLTIARNIDTQSLLAGEQHPDAIGQGAGVGSLQCSHASGKKRAFALFNPSPFTRKQGVEITLWDWEEEAADVVAADLSGNPLSCQLLESGGYWGHRFDRYLVEATIPAGGYTTVLLFAQPDYTQRTIFEPDRDAMRRQVPEKFVLENEYLRVELAADSGAIVSLYDKERQVELADTTQPCGVLRLAVESAHKEITDWKTGMSSWFVGRYKSIQPLGAGAELVPEQRGKLVNGYRITYPFGASQLQVVVSLEAQARELQYDVHCDWREFGCGESGIPNLHFYLPLAYEVAGCRCDVPGGVVRRQLTDMDIPAESFILAEPAQGASGVVLFSRDKYGVRCHNNSLSLTMLRGATDPDPTPDIGSHHMRFWLAAVGADRSDVALCRHSECLQHPITVQSLKAHAGSLPAQQQLVEICGGEVSLSSLKLAEHNPSALVVRVFSHSDRQQQVRIGLGFSATKAYCTDILEQEVGDACVLSHCGTQLEFSMGPRSCQTVLLQIPIA